MSFVGLDQAAAFLVEHLGRDVGEVELVGEGAWSRCFGFVDEGRPLVARFGRHVDDFVKDRRAATFAAPGLPVPHVVEIGPAFDGWFAISTRAFGDPLEARAADEWPAVLPAIVAALDGIRTIDVTGTTGFGGWDAEGRGTFPTWRDFLLAVDTDEPARRTHGWRRKLVDSPVGDGPFRAGLARLRTVVDSAEGVRAVAHRDLLNRNVLVADDRVTAVFDWGCSVYGDFLYDLAWFVFWAPWHAGLEALDLGPTVLRHLAETGVAVPDADARLRGCLLHIGLDHQAYCAWTGDHDDLIRITAQTNALLD